jgi:hypothetical protein
LNITKTSSKVEWQIFWLPLRAFCVSVRMRPASSRIWTLDETVDCGRLREAAMSFTFIAPLVCRALRILIRAGEASPRSTSMPSSGSTTRKLRLILYPALG